MLPAAGGGMARLGGPRSSIVHLPATWQGLPSGQASRACAQMLALQSDESPWQESLWRARVGNGACKSSQQMGSMKKIIHRFQNIFALKSIFLHSIFHKP